MYRLRIPTGARYFSFPQCVHTNAGAQSISKFFSRGKAVWGVKRTIRLYLVTSLQWKDFYLHSPTRLHDVYWSFTFFTVFRSAKKIAKSAQFASLCLSVNLSSVPPWASAWNNSGTHWRDCNGILYLRIFRKSAKKNSGFIKIWQECRVIYMKTCVHFWSYLSEFFLEWEMFQTKDVEKIKTHILCSITLSENRDV
jgi:hypothetical protein